jgi:signal transduction histidine kinase
VDEKASVLIVDDESSARDTLEALLFREGYDLAFAASGSEALARLDELKPDVILLDVIMPGMDGIEVCQRLKTDERWRHIPIILVTVLDSKEDLARGLDAGADDFLSKPVSDLELRARVRSMLRIKKQYDKLIGAITERKRAEEQLQHYAVELEQANEEVKQFAYIVSHDLRGPLTNLKGFTEELGYALEVIGSAINTALPHLEEKQQQAVTTALQEDVPEALGFINSSVTCMDNFINAILKLSRLGRRELKFEPVNMEAIVQVTLETLAHQIEERQVRVTVGPLPEVVADRASMEQIMGNLLGNTVKYLDPDRSGEIEITGERDRDEMTLRVRDNGRGIAGEDMDKVFAPFRRAGRQDVPGEGMGLPYVQTLVRRHGGHTWCESELGVGTTFVFTLPVKQPKGENGQ